MPDEYLIQLLPIAEEDFKEIVLFIAQDNPIAAEKVASRIETNLQNLSTHPHSGRIPNEIELARSGFRYLVVDDYLIFYTIEETTIYIHRIIHGARDYRRLL